jgi:hypothetical protein
MSIWLPLEDHYLGYRQIRYLKGNPVGRLENRLPRGRALRDRGQARCFQDPPNSRAAHAVADVLQGAVDPRVGQVGFSVAIRMTRCRISAKTPGRPGRDFAYVHFRAMSCRCQRRIVSGVTIAATCARRRRASRKPIAAKRRRSSSVNRTRWLPRRAFRTRFSSRRHWMTSCCSCWSQPTRKVTSRCSGATRRVYVNCRGRRFRTQRLCPRSKSLMQIAKLSLFDAFQGGLSGLQVLGGRKCRKESIRLFNCLSRSTAFD